MGEEFEAHLRSVATQEVQETGDGSADLLCVSLFGGIALRMLCTGANSSLLDLVLRRIVSSGQAWLHRTLPRSNHALVVFLSCCDNAARLEVCWLQLGEFHTSRND